MNRLLADLAACSASAFPRAPFWVPRKFRVVRMHSGDNRVELQPCVKALGLPEILPVDIWPGMAGLKSALTPGAEVLVQFVDGDPGQPVITHFAPPDAQGFVPVELYLQAGSTGAYPTEHATSIEAVAGLIGLVLYVIGQANQGPLTGIALSGPPGTPTISAPVVAFINTAIAAMAIPGIAGTPPISGDITPYMSAIGAALSAKLPNVLGTLPNVGWPNVMGG